jgi:predicted nucleotidyltransferase
MAVRESIKKVFEPFLKEILESYREEIHSVHIVGSCLTPDYDEKTSDINSIVVLKEMNLGFVEFLAPLGRKYKKRSVAAPLIMTPEYIQNSLDVFPIEFFNFKLIHETVYGEDLLKDLSIENRHMRLQVERELKTKLIWLRQGYISTMGDRRLLVENLKNSIKGYIPLFRAIISLFGEEVPVASLEVIKKLEEITKVNCLIYEKIFMLKKGRISPGKDELDRYFEEYYISTERLGRIVDELS